MSIFGKFKKKDDEAAEAKVAPVVEAAKTVKSEKKEKKDKPEAKPVKEKTETTSNKEFFGVVIRPLITEKAALLAQFNQYLFEVDRKANKIEIARAIESRYGVRPIRINSINTDGKFVRYGRNFGQLKNWKKVVATLPEGKSIQTHEGV